MNFGVPLAFGVCFFLVVAQPAEAQSSDNGLQSIRRFPHFVTITNDKSETGYNCSGSIIADKWILTALNCVRSERFTVYFLLGNFNNPSSSFSLSLDNSAVIPYPTGVDNIALIKLPFALEFSDLLKSIPYHGFDGEYDRVNNGFAVMAGFNTAITPTLTYGMYRILCRSECKNYRGELFDEYREICAIDWNKRNTGLTGGNEGSGLIQGWPREPRLIGIFGDPTFNGWESGRVFIRLSKYRQWIDQVLNSHGRHKTLVIEPRSPPTFPMYA